MTDFPHLENLSDEDAAYLAEVQELGQKEARRVGERCAKTKPGYHTVEINDRARIHFKSKEDADKWLRDNSKGGYLRGFFSGLIGG